ncbi:hypothetical protein DTO207G8_4405 [Paecilomyces variotii]|nr:hypothetical protein DTO207G8_4405 [Paecilomyces variotii]
MSVFWTRLRNHQLTFRISSSSSPIYHRAMPTFNNHIHIHNPLSARTVSSISIPSTRREFPQSGFKTIPPTKRIEEELLPSYRPEDYYPVYIGEIFRSRYQVVCKLGYGTSSTVWLCRDLWNKQYLTLKVCVRAGRKNHEITISNYLKNQNRALNHPGRKRVRIVIDCFDIHGPHGTHNCLLYETLGQSYTDLISSLPDGDRNSLPKDLLQRGVTLLLMALDYLHEAGVVHTDVSSNNLLQGIEDPSILSRMEEDEMKHPTARKILPDRHIYCSRQMPPSAGFPVLCDLDQARIGCEKQHGDIMPGIYRAPEVILDMEWNEKVDIWAVGMTAWDLFEGSQMFFARRNGLLSNEEHLAEMVSLLGPPPADFLQRSERSWRYFDDRGTWKGTIPIPNETLQSREHKLYPNDQHHFISFLRKILRWKPEERPSAAELVTDDFLLAGIGETRESIMRRK